MQFLGNTDRMNFAPGTARWAAFRTDDSQPYVYTRFGLRGSRLVITDLYFIDEEGLGTDDLRRIPFGRVEALANGPYRGALEEYWDDDPEPDPKRNVFATVEDVTDVITSLATSTDPHLYDHLLGYSDGAKTIELVEKWRELAGRNQVTINEFLQSTSGKNWRRSFARVALPKSRPYPKEFYERVAQIYGALAAIGSRKPATEIALATSRPGLYCPPMG